MLLNKSGRADLHYGEDFHRKCRRTASGVTAGLSPTAGVNPTGGDRGVESTTAKCSPVDFTDRTYG